MHFFTVLFMMIFFQICFCHKKISHTTKSLQFLAFSFVVIETSRKPDIHIKSTVSKMYEILLC